LYFKRPETLQKEWALLRDPSKAASKVYKNVLACLVYRMFDYAVSIVKSAQEQGVLTVEECESTASQIKNFSKKGAMPSFPGRLFFYKVFRRLCQKLTPPSYLGWADGDDTIGNVKDR
jgi:hypothetical protein